MTEPHDGGFEYWNERYEKEGASYVGKNSMDERLCEDQMNKFWGALREVFKDCDHVLDFGCGTGRLYPHVLPHVTDYTGCDIVDTVLDHPISMPFYQIFKGKPLPLQDNSVDAVVGCTVFQHMIEIDDFRWWIKECKRVTRDTGTIYLIESLLNGQNFSDMQYRSYEETAKEFHLGDCTVQDLNIDEPKSHYLLYGSNCKK